jgi:hypothetical protein
MLKEHIGQKRRLEETIEKILNTVKVMREAVIYSFFSVVWRKRERKILDSRRAFLYLYWQCIKVYYLSIFRNSYPPFPLWSHQNKL